MFNHQYRVISRIETGMSRDTGMLNLYPTYPAVGYFSTVTDFLVYTSCMCMIRDITLTYMNECNFDTNTEKIR